MGAEAEVIMCQQSVVRPPPVVDVKCFVSPNVHEIEELVTTIASPLSPPSIERIRISESSTVSVDPSSSKPEIKSVEDIPDEFPKPSGPQFVPSIRSGSFADVGPRRSMEDEHIRIDDLSSYLGSSYTLPKPNAFYGVFDGHGGPEAAAYVRKNVMRLFFEIAEFPQSSLVDDFFLGEVENSTRRAFLSADLALAADTSVSSCSGTTALTAFVFGRLLMVANAGDCRAVLCRKGEAIDMSEDHRPIYPSERRRVEELGGFVDDGYLNGVLSVTRALGDWDMKVPKGSSPLIADPEFRQVILLEDDEFLIMGCDGIWDVMSSQHAVNVVRRGLRRHDDPEQCARDLVKEALRLCTFDNLTVIVVCFTPLDHREPPHPQERRLRCCSFSSEALCSLRSFLDGGGSSSR